MATYLPVLLVSVNAGMPDDASLQPLPRGQVDYLSHEWDEEDVWRSWRNMTKQKNEIANGIRLENASWRTWWKQRNRLKTVSPEALNWLKDSDVTWLYGPLHTAVDWVPLGNAPMTPPNGFASARKQVKTLAPAKPPNCISSPSSSINLDRFNPQVSRYGIGDQHTQQPVMKPILKHRSIAEMLSSTLPPTPSWADDDAAAFPLGDVEEEEENEDGSNMNILGERRSSFGGKFGRPSMFHTKSDTHLLPRFGRKKMRTSPPRVASVVTQQDPDNNLSASQRIHASNNLAELAWNATTTNAPVNSLGWPVGTPRQSPQTIENSDSSGSDPGSGRSEVDVGTYSPNIAQVPSKKHISFNAIVEQCIAIDSMSVPMSPSILEEETWPGFEDGYAVDDEGALYENIKINGNYDSDDQMADEDDDDVLEIKPPSHRGSIDGEQDPLAVRESISSHTDGMKKTDNPKRPPLYRSSTGRSSKQSRSARSLGSGSRRSSLSASQNRSRSSLGGVSEREHVSIAPIAPTILKTGGTEDEAEDVLYMGTTGLHGTMSHSTIRGNSTSLGNAINSANFAGGLYSSSGYGYGGYGYGEQVSEGRSEAYEHFERGTEAGELVYQSPNGNVYPWEETDALRYRMRSEYGIPSPATSPPETSLSPLQRRVNGSDSMSGDHSMFVPERTFVRSGPSSEEPEIEYLDTVRPATQAQNSEEAIISQEGQFSIDRDDVARLVIPGVNGTDSTQYSFTKGTVGRTPSPDFQPKVNPRIASLKSEGAYRSPTSSNLTATAPDPANETTNIPTTLLNIHPESSIQQSGLLSPPDVSPGRGRQISTSPVSGHQVSSSPSSPSPAGVSRSISDGRRDSRSDSRGRSRTRSSISPSDQEMERGRSRSRSTASGANSPMSDSSSPHARYPPMVIGIGGHSGREIRDGRGTRLYRKTSEDFMGASSSSSPSSSSPRGRNREGRRVSESLSPPVGTGSAEVLNRPGTISPSYSNLRSIPTSGLGLQSYVADDSLKAEHNLSGPKSAVVWLTEPAAPMIGRGASTDSTSSMTSSSSTTSINGRPLPPSIPEEDERSKVEAQLSDAPQKSSQSPPSTQNKVEVAIPQHENNRPNGQQAASSAENTPSEASSTPIWQSRTKANDLVTSARSFIGSIWSGSST